MTLSEELAKPAYAGLTDEQAAAAINAATVPVDRPIDPLAVKRYLMVVGKWPRIAALARGLVTGSDAETLVAVALTEALDNMPSFDFTVPAYKAACQANLAACVSAGLIDQPHRDAIEAMAQPAVPLRSTLGVDNRPLLPIDIERARNGTS